MQKALDINNLHVSYQDTKALHDISLSVDRGKIVGIVGPNGAGKSTLIKAVLGLTPIDSGNIEIYGKTLTEMRKRVAYVPQRANIDWNFPIIVKKTVLLGTYPRLGIFKRPKRKDKEWAMECLRKVGMEEYAHRQIGELSGGEQQRVFMARALAQKADCYFLDEPFIGIDVTSENIIINILRELRNQGKTIFVVHHDLTKVEGLFDDIILINKELIGCGPVNKIFVPKLVEEAYDTSLSMLKSLGGFN
ncbi:MAG: metal ABC transporter ATP-binding protein [Bacteroidales bacterium]|nr:metal ABC transporter ATP-binding protein [Bacteroidales bacterium]